MFYGVGIPTTAKHARKIDFSHVSSDFRNVDLAHCFAFAGVLAPYRAPFAPRSTRNTRPRSAPRKSAHTRKPRERITRPDRRKRTRTPTIDGHSSARDRPKTDLILPKTPPKSEAPDIACRGLFPCLDSQKVESRKVESRSALRQNLRKSESRRVVQLSPPESSAASTISTSTSIGSCSCSRPTCSAYFAATSSELGSSVTSASCRCT